MLGDESNVEGEREVQLQGGAAGAGKADLVCSGTEGNVLPGCQGCQTGKGPKR